MYVQFTSCVYGDLTCKVANKSLNVRERVKVIERNKDGPFPSPAVLWIVSKIFSKYTGKHLCRSLFFK